MPRYAVIHRRIVRGVLVADQPPSLDVPVGYTFVDVTDVPAITGGEYYDVTLGLFSSENSVEAQKQQFLITLQSQMTAIGHLLEKAESLAAVFADRGYDAAASNPIINADLVDYGVVQYDLGVAINVLQQLQALFSGQATSPSAAYDAIVNKWRQL